MPKAHIQTPDGTTITIEGGAAEIASIVHRIQTPTAGTALPGSRPSPAQDKRNRKKPESAFGRVMSLKDEGFFNQPKSLATVAAELEKLGYLYPVTSLSGVMLSLVQKRVLTRVKRDKVWVYGKR
jgi:hypothetical protein